MAHSSSVFRTSILLLSLATTWQFLTARPLTANIAHTTANSTTLMARLKLHDGNGQGGGSNSCWDSLFELQSCTGEVILFFLNGETYLGAGCCMAIEKIERKCLPTLLESLGFTSEEGDILRGYCDASNGNDDVPTTTPPPQTANVTTPAASATISNGGRF